MSGDQVSQIIRKAINILFVSNPKATSIGIVIGVVIDGVIGLFTPFLKGIEWISISSVKMWHLIGLGIITMNLPSYLRRKEVDPSIKNAIEFIEKEKTKGNVTEWQARQMYSNLHQKVLENVVLETSKQEITDQVASLSSSDENVDK